MFEMDEGCGGVSKTDGRGKKWDSSGSVTFATCY